MHFVQNSSGQQNEACTCIIRTDNTVRYFACTSKVKLWELLEGWQMGSANALVCLMIYMSQKSHCCSVILRLRVPVSATLTEGCLIKTTK